MTKRDLLEQSQKTPYRSDRFQFLGQLSYCKQNEFDSNTCKNTNEYLLSTFYIPCSNAYSDSTQTILTMRRLKVNIITSGKMVKLRHNEAKWFPHGPVTRHWPPASEAGSLSTGSIVSYL